MLRDMRTLQRPATACNLPLQLIKMPRYVVADEHGSEEESSEEELDDDELEELEEEQTAEEEQAEQPAAVPKKISLSLKKKQAGAEGKCHVSIRRAALPGSRLQHALHAAPCPMDSWSRRRVFT